MMEVVLTSVRVCYVTDPGDRRVSGISEEVRGCIVRAVDYLEEKCGTPAKQVLRIIVECNQAMRRNILLEERIFGLFGSPFESM